MKSYRVLTENLTKAEIWQRVKEMPESKKYSRLVNLARPHSAEAERLIKEMWAIPAKTSEGRRAKLVVLLGCIMEERWREGDWAADWDVLMARNLMIEFVGGEPAEQLRDQFA
jgi:hypothetical protein